MKYNLYLCRVTLKKMTRNATQRAKQHLPKFVKYIVLDKIKQQTTVFQFKKDVAVLMGISIRTLERNKYYDSGDFIYSIVVNVV